MISVIRILATLLLLAAGAVSAAAFPHPDDPPENRLELTVPDFPATGYILDIGGGGEGVIGQLKPAQTIAIDLIRRELEEAPPGPLKIVMDARDLKFLDGTFPTATSFFTLMYIAEDDQPKVFGEVFRVLAPGGRFLIWDVILPPRSAGDPDHPIFRFLFHLPGGKDIRTGYGTRWPSSLHDTAYFVRLAEAAGFTVVKRSGTAPIFHLELRKP